MANIGVVQHALLTKSWRSDIEIGSPDTTSPTAASCSWTLQLKEEWPTVKFKVDGSGGVGSGYLAVSISAGQISYAWHVMAQSVSPYESPTDDQDSVLISGASLVGWPVGFSPLFLVPEALDGHESGRGGDMEHSTLKRIVIIVLFYIL